MFHRAKPYVFMAWIICFLVGARREALRTQTRDNANRHGFKVSPQAIPLYTITDLGVLPGYSESTAFSINEQGDIALLMTKDDEHFYVCLWRKGKMTVIGTLGGRFSGACRIGQKGEIVGASETKQRERHAFLWKNGKMQDIGRSNEKSEACGINTKGQIAGTVTTYDDHSYAFILSNGNMKDVGQLMQNRETYACGINEAGRMAGTIKTKEGERAFVFQAGTGKILPTLGGGVWSLGINNRGDVVGYADISKEEFHAFLYTDKVIDIGTLGGETSAANHINNRRQIVGRSKFDPLNNDEHAFLWQNGKMVDLNTLFPKSSRWELKNAYCINDKGQIVGEGILDGKIRAYLLNPAQ